MYDTSKLLNTDLESILTKVGEYNIYKHYIGSFKVNTVFKSPLRNKDNNPSFGIFISSHTNKLLFKDLATGETGNCIKFVKLFYRFNTYAETIEQIKRDFTNNTILKIDKTIYNKNITINNCIIQIKKQKYTNLDISYWNTYNISIDILNKYKVNPIQYLFINNKIVHTYSVKEPMYSYLVFKQYKIYRPLSDKTQKWYGTTTAYDVQGYEQLPETGELLIITKALKDVMVLDSLNYNAIAPNSESTPIPEVIIDNLKKRFKRIVLLYDRDLGGLKGARKMVQLYNLDFVFIPKYTNIKDISDYIKYNQKDKTIDLINKLLNK